MVFAVVDVAICSSCYSANVVFSFYRTVNQDLDIFNTRACNSYQNSSTIIISSSLYLCIVESDVLDRVQGKNLVDANGKIVVLHGVMDTPNRYFNGWRWQQWKADYSEADIQPCLDYFSKQFSAITDKKHGLFEECCGYACMNWYKEWYLKQNTTGIKQLETQADVVSTLYYNIEGKEVEKPTTGVYIIKQLLSNGKIRFRKVFLK